MSQSGEVFTVKGSDADTGTNAEIVYSLVKSSQQFSIDPSSGAITLKVRLVHTCK